MKRSNLSKSSVLVLFLLCAHVLFLSNIERDNHLNFLMKTDAEKY